MSYLVLARKWRPKSFKTLVGQEHVVQALVNGLDQDRVHHAFLFTGTRGVGKTTIARILAKCLNCDTGVTSEPCGECSSCVDIDAGRFVDMMEINAADRTGVDETRELLESVQYSPSRGRFKVYIIDEVHMLSKSSFNALLKTLEEPPPHVKFLLATTNPEHIPVTILSRCLQFNLKRLMPDQIQGYLDMIVQSEGIEYESEALVQLSRAADGSMRDGLSLLDQAIVYGGGKLSADHVKQMLGVVDHEHIAAMISALVNADASALLSIVEELLAQSRDIDHVLASLAETCHRICLLQAVPDYSDAERSDWASIKTLAETLTAQDAQLYYQIAVKGRQELSIAPDPRTGLEMILLRMLAFRPVGASSMPAAVGGAGSTVKPRPQKATVEVKPVSVTKPSAVITADSSAVIPSPEISKPVATAIPHDDVSEAPVVSKPVEPVKPEPEAETSEPAEQLFSFAQDTLPKTDGSNQKEHKEPESQSEVHTAGGNSVQNDSDWIELASRLDLKGSVRELARNLHLKSKNNGQWDFVITRSLKHLNSKTSVDRLNQALSEQLGQSVMIRVIDSEEAGLKTAAKLEERQLHTKMSDAEKAIEDDPNIQSLKNQMGAKIVEDSIQPLQ
jgi:DNA polymerase-3 subunit gamma/tau